MDKELIELQTEYLKGLPEKLDQIYELVLNLEKKKNYRESLNSLKGIIHSIKGSSGSYEIHFLSELCHKFEDQIASLEEGKSDTSKSFLFIDLMREYLDFYNPEEKNDGPEFNKRLDLLSSKNTDFKLIEKNSNDLKNILVISYDKFISEAVRLSLSKYKVNISLIENKNETEILNGKINFDQIFIDESAHALLPTICNWRNDGTFKKPIKIFFISSSKNFNLPTNKIILLNKSHLLIRDLKNAFHKETELSKEAPKKILLVDDDESLHPLFKKAFSDFKETEVITASSSKEAFKIIENGSIDLLILDLMMPEINGIEILKTLKNQKNQIPIIFLTGISKSDEIKELMDLGAKGVISKPFKIGLLAGQIMNIWCSF